MTLYKQWIDLMEGQSEETFESFWKEYSETETRVYEHILSHKDAHLSGTVSELVSKFEADPVIFMGFLDGINTSLREANDLEKIQEDTALDLDVDYDKLFFNMLKERRTEIVKEFKRSKTVHKEKQPGRNDPCPCGSGKKYKKCCGAAK